MEKIKSILSPGKHVEDEILYGSGGGGQYEHTGREAPGSTGAGYYGQTSSQPQIYNRGGDPIPSQPSTAQDYGKTGDEYLAAEKERAAKSRVARESSTTEKKNGHRKSRSGEHKESRNPYTQQAVGPRLGEGSEESKIAARNAQAQAIGAGYSIAQGSQGAAAAGLVGTAGAAGAAGAAGTSKKGVTMVPMETDSPHGEVVGRTVSGHHTVERTASGQYRTRLASIIDPNYGEGVKTSESAEPRVASVALPNGTKYIDPKAAEDYGLGYNPPTGSGYGGQGQPQVATTKSEADHAVSGDQTGHKGAGVVGAGVAGAAVADAGYEGTKTDRAQPRDVDDPAYRTSRVHGVEETTTTHKADKSAKKAASKAAPERLDESAYAVKPTAARYGDVGNDYGKGVKDPRYGLPIAAAGISAEEAAAIRRNEANVARPAAQGQAYTGRPTTVEQDYAAQPATANQAYGTQHATQAEQQAAKHAEEKKPSRRSSILGFLHLGKDKKKHSKDAQRQPYTDLTGQAPLGSVAGTGFGQQQSLVPGSTVGHGQTADLAYRDRMPSTADVPAFTGGLVGPNGTPLRGASAANPDSSAWAKSTEKEVMDRGGMGQGAYGSGGGAATNQAAYGDTGATNQAAYDTGIDESYAAPTGTGATQVRATQKSGSLGAATTGGAIVAGAAAGGLAAGGVRGSQAHEGVASDYNMQSAQDKGAPNQDHLYDQVSPRSSKAQQQTNYKETKTNHSKETTKSNHKSHNKDKNNTAYAGSDDAQTRDAEYGGYENDPRMGSAAQGGYGSNAPTYDTSATNGAVSNSVAYGGKETQARNAAYSGGAQNAGEAAFGNEEYVGSGLSRHGTTKVAEREGHHVLHKGPPASHPAAAMAGVE
ncbi:hypothetical protein VC83_00802 [Pseudogymnoascus destructans]|uniref:Uncharacterized protein n=1 Tax=Pseudogymnoascus destructans TaxID=655981 RepID=A0A177AJY5_9PEZI|nr:uncharacterized protein VC83_00802 [Pseudogymnoascus destructans]OAF62387.2 hypothetical protein VC83_00802 [Pseudogymnoascus destructans]